MKAFFHTDAYKSHTFAFVCAYGIQTCDTYLSMGIRLPYEPIKQGIQLWRMAYEFSMKQRGSVCFKRMGIHVRTETLFSRCSVPQYTQCQWPLASQWSVRAVSLNWHWQCEPDPYTEKSTGCQWHWLFGTCPKLALPGVCRSQSGARPSGPVHTGADGAAGARRRAHPAVPGAGAGRAQGEAQGVGQTLPSPHAGGAEAVLRRHGSRVRREAQVPAAPEGVGHRAHGPGHPLHQQV